jgi:hypothetical protein
MKMHDIENMKKTLERHMSGYKPGSKLPPVLSDLKKAVEMITYMETALRFYAKIDGNPGLLQNLLHTRSVGRKAKDAIGMAEYNRILEEEKYK